MAFSDTNLSCVTDPNGWYVCTEINLSEMCLLDKDFGPLCIEDAPS